MILSDESYCTTHTCTYWEIAGTTYRQDTMNNQHRNILWEYVSTKAECFMLTSETLVTYPN